MSETVKVRMRKRLVTLLDRLDTLPQPKLRLLHDLLEGTRFQLGGYAVAKTVFGWAMESVTDGYGEHNINAALTDCSCEDCRFRQRECKHILMLRKLLHVPGTTAESA